MSKIIHLISDLHLSEDDPHLLALFENYMQDIAPESEQLFVLGDFFDAWIGDDFTNELINKVVSLLQEYARSNRDLFIMHGNRDFLIGQEFSEKCSAKLINDPYQIEWEGKSISMMHGDTLCTDDVDYQKFRAMVRNAQWQQNVMSVSIDDRLKFVRNIKQQTKDAKSKKKDEIMDVNPDAVLEFFNNNKCDWLIHGHTHRECQHQLKTEKGANVKRIVLSDWGRQGHYLSLKDNQIKSNFFNLENQADKG